jgi:hypothetical protein
MPIASTRDVKIKTAVDQTKLSSAQTIVSRLHCSGRGIGGYPCPVAVTRRDCGCPHDSGFLDTPAGTRQLTPDRDGITILIAERGRLFLTASTRHELMRRAAEWQRCGGASVEGARPLPAKAWLGGLRMTIAGHRNRSNTGLNNQITHAVLPHCHYIKKTGFAFHQTGSWRGSDGEL